MVVLVTNGKPFDADQSQVLALHFNGKIKSLMIVGSLDNVHEAKPLGDQFSPRETFEARLKREKETKEILAATEAYCGNTNPTKVTDALITVFDALRTDNDMWQGWKENIAQSIFNLLKQQYIGHEHKNMANICNQGAENFLQLLIKK